MTDTAIRPLTTTDYRVADISLAEFGRKEISGVAEHENAGADVAARASLARASAAARRSHHRGPSYMATIQDGRLLNRDPLVALGAEVRWASVQHLLHAGSRRRRDRGRARRNA